MKRQTCSSPSPSVSYLLPVGPVAYDDDVQLINVIQTITIHIVGEIWTATSYPLEPRPISQTRRNPALGPTKTEARGDPGHLKSRAREWRDAPRAFLCATIPTGEASPFSASGARSAFFRSDRRSSCARATALPGPGRVLRGRIRPITYLRRDEGERADFVLRLQHSRTPLQGIL